MEEDHHKFNLDYVGNASSLVPLTKATLSQRQSISHLVSFNSQDNNDQVYDNQINID